MKRFRLLLLPCIAVVVCACGFHLRGSQVAADIGSAAVFIDETRSVDLAAEMRSQLSGTGARVLDSAQGADYVIQLRNERTANEVLSVSPDTGKAEEYRIVLRVDVSVHAPGDGAMLLLNEPVTVSHDYTVDEEAVLSKFTEEEVLHGEMQRDAASRILRRVAAVVRTR